jgi:hypothetical protein
MPLPEVEEILKKYQQQEQKVDNLFQNRLFSCLLHARVWNLLFQ